MLKNNLRTEDWNLARRKLNKWSYNRKGWAEVDDPSWRCRAVGMTSVLTGHAVLIAGWLETCVTFGSQCSRVNFVSQVVSPLLIYGSESWVGRPYMHIGSGGYYPLSSSMGEPLAPPRLSEVLPTSSPATILYSPNCHLTPHPTPSPN